MRTQQVIHSGRVSLVALPPRPNEAQLANHSLPIAFLPEDKNELFPHLAESILNSKNIRILTARYLNLSAQSREGKLATSVIVSVHPGDVPTMGSSIGLFSRSRTVEHAYPSNRYTQCKNCWGYGHVALRCPSTDPVCTICSLNHTRAMHRCPNPTCPGGGNLNATPGCCSSSPPRCANWDGPTLRLTGIVSPAPLRPLSGVPPLPKRLFSRRLLVTRRTWPLTIMTSRARRHPPALSSRRSRWLLQEPEAHQCFRPL